MPSVCGDPVGSGTERACYVLGVTDEEQETTPAPAFRLGAIAMIDVLGWKGIWKRQEKQCQLAPVETMQMLRGMLAKYQEQLVEPSLESARSLPARGDLSFGSAFISDTVVIHSGVTPAEDASFDLFGHKLTGDKANNAYSSLADVQVLRVSKAVSLILRWAALAKTPLLFRGAVATGLYHADDNFIIGPAVDKAAEAMDLPGAAVVWCIPTTTNALDRGSPLVHDLPIRSTHGYRTIEAKIVDPFDWCTDQHQVRAIRDGMKRAFGKSDEPEIVAKFQETTRIIDALVCSHQNLPDPQPWDDQLETRRPDGDET